MIENLKTMEHREFADRVTYHAANRLLIIAGQDDIMPVIAKLTGKFRLTCLISPATDANTLQFLLSQNVNIVSASSPVNLSGYLGNFSLGDGNGDVFDQVLDLQEPAAIGSRITPPGYYCLSNRRQSLPEMLAELPDMIGEFDKPKFFNLKPHLCAHQQRGIGGCRRCIEICATRAISSEQDRIQVNPYLCQGCGDCATICPAGAINYQYPDRVATLAAVKQWLSEETAILLIYSGTLSAAFGEFTLPLKMLEVEAIGSTGMEIWLGALAFGARQVWLFDDHEMTAETRLVLSMQIVQANTLLAGLGYPDNLIQLAGQGDFTVRSDFPAINRATFQPDSDKRTMIRMAVEHLEREHDSKTEFCVLPEPASFGSIAIDPQGCTLCMSCVSVCPEQALLAGNDTPQLKFIEAHCVQCGICSKACPEQVITLLPRYLYDSLAARKPRLLHQEAAFLCIQCGKPFATQSMISNILQKLEHHPMFQGKRKQQLMMCEQCKVVAMFGNQ